MAMTPEAKVKKKVVDILKKNRIYYFYPVTSGFGSSGVPDIVACYKGWFIGIECKAGKNKPTDLQKKNLDNILRCGGVALIVNENNVGKLDALLEKLP